MATNDLKDLPDSCPGCGKPLAEWTEMRAGGSPPAASSTAPRSALSATKPGAERVRTRAQPPLSGWEAPH